MRRLKDAHYRDLNEQQVSNFLTAITSLCAGTRFEEDIFDWSTHLELELCLKLIACPYFEKKLRGVSLISSICERNEYILKTDLFEKWKAKVRLVELLFVSDNQEFIKKSCELVRFLFVKGHISEGEVEEIWKSREGKHETVIKEIYTLISEFPLYQTDVEAKLKLFGKISAVPKEEWDEDYIRLIKEMSDNSYGMYVR